MSSITKESLEILKNEEIIAINQDPVVGTSVTPFRWGEVVSVFFRVPADFETGLVPLVLGLTMRLRQPDWTNNYTLPAQYWSGESQNGTIFMLVSLQFFVS